MEDLFEARAEGGSCLLSQAAWSQSGRVMAMTRRKFLPRPIPENEILGVQCNISGAAAPEGPLAPAGQLTLPAERYFFGVLPLLLVQSLL
jgi:hypothetical protein